ncbi:MAG: hypothetical protein QM651_13675 [Rhodoblastus sp.]
MNRKTARDTQRCYGCLFWEENRGSYHGFGWCRRSPPARRMNEVETERDYWCAEWADRNIQRPAGVAS